LSLGAGFLAALGFLTRLGPAQELEARELAPGLTFFPFIGLMLGMILVLPFAYGFLPGHHWVQALVMLGASLWLTRALHWDGWCDVWDAWGSGKSGDEFFRVIKDSRAGSFGVLALCMAVFGQLFLFRQILALEAFHIVPWALLLGRGCAAILAVAARNMPRHGLAGQFLSHARPWMLGPIVLQVLITGAVFAIPTSAVLALALSSLGVLELYHLARRNGALNGDFLGAAVIWGELSALLAWNLTGGAKFPGILSWWPWL
jgi:adenosylcobinamide-GDP ribazoletransferase